MKIIEGLKPWEVMRLYEEEGKDFVHKPYLKDEWRRDHNGYGLRFYLNRQDEVAIIDDSQPEIDWEKFDWDFFNQYGGLKVVNQMPSGVKNSYIIASACQANDYAWLKPKESPFYPWFGGECPVPENVEVEVTRRVVLGRISKAKYLDWSNKKHDREQDIIAFRLTGRVL